MDLVKLFIRSMALVLKTDLERLCVGDDRHPRSVLLRTGSHFRVNLNVAIRLELVVKPLSESMNGVDVQCGRIDRIHVGEQMLESVRNTAST